MRDVTIAPYRTHHRDQVLDLSLRAWEPVFAEMVPAVPDYVYRSFYPDGWRVRQTHDILALLDQSPEMVWVALREDKVLGWVGLRFHPTDRMGEIHILAVDPHVQHQGIARALMDVGFDQMRKAGLDIVMVETGGDPGHAASRTTYERAGFERWPVARYFRKL